MNDRELAVLYLDALGKAQMVGHDEVTQRLSVVESGMRVQQALGGTFSTPLSEAISALRRLNAAVNVAKHEDAMDEDKPLAGGTGKRARAAAEAGPRAAREVGSRAGVKLR